MFENFRIFTRLMFIEASSNIKHLVYKATVYANNNNAMMYSGHGMEWNGNFGMEYGRCQNGMEDFKNGMEDNLPYFHTNSILDFMRCIYRKIHTDVG